MAACTRVPWSKFWQNPRRCCLCWRSDRLLSQQADIATVEPVIPRGQVTIPKKKKRDSLSILKALASTVEQVKGPQYEDIDDPYLTTSRMDMFPCYMSKASGQKTARYFINKYRNAFDHEDMAPFVKAFQPDVTDYQYTTLCNEAILERLQRREVSKAVEVYDKMKQQELEVSEEAKLELLEMMCMFDSHDPPEQQFPLELVFSTLSESQDTLTQSPILAQDVFDDLAEKTEDAYNWMLQGSLVNNKGEPALFLYKEMKSHKVKVQQNSYHLLLKRASVMAYLTNVQTSDITEALLREMEEQGMRPNIVTLESLIEGMYRNHKFFLDRFPNYLAEFTRLGIEPTYRTWCLLVEVLHRFIPSNRQGSRPMQPPSQTTVEQIKQYIRDSITHMQAHPQDIYFQPNGGYFSNVMNLCRYMEDSELAILVNDFKDSLGSKFIVTNINFEAAYYHRLFDVLNRSEPCETIMKIYNKTYGQCWADGEIFQKVLASVHTFKEYHHLPNLFEDCMQKQPPGTMLHYDVLMSFFSMMSRDNHTEELQIQFSNQAKHMFSVFKATFEDRRAKEKGQLPRWGLGVYLIKVFLNSGDLNSAWECFMLFHRNHYNIDQFRWKPELLVLLNKIIEAKDQAKLERFVHIADADLSHLVDIHAFSPKLETFMSKEDIDALKKSQRTRTRAKYDV